MNSAALANATLPKSSAGSKSPSRWLQRTGQLVFWAWAILLSLVVGSLMVGHWYSLPRPSGDLVTQRALNALRAPNDDERWLAVHVLYGQCRCSRRIFEHLLETARPEGVSEKIVFVGDDPEAVARAHAKGFSVEVVTKSELGERFHIAAAPLLAIVAPEGSVRYLGGYTETKQGPDIRDLALIEAMRGDGDARELPLFGCAVSKELQAVLDPLGIKYSSER